MNPRIRKIHSLLQHKGTPKIWRIIDGVCNQPGYPEQVRPHDIKIHVQIIKSADMLTNSETGQRLTDKELQGIEEGTIDLVPDYSKMDDNTLREIAKGNNPFNIDEK